MSSEGSGCLRSGEALGDYLLERRVGLGGMAEVWLARRDGQPFALKVLHANLARDPAFRAMFRDETELAQSLDHPHVVRVHDAIEARGVQIQVMEWIDGCDLSALEVQLERDGGRFPVPAAVAIVRGVARGLHAAHGLVGPDGRSRRFVHRDVAPQNVMVGRDGAVKLLDFGVAKARARLTRTQAGVIKGRIGYMAPEQALGRELTPLADVYALGVVFWELLAMERLFPAGGQLLDVIERDPPRRLDGWVPGVEPPLGSLVGRMLEPRPEERASLREVLDVLALEAEPDFDLGAWCRSVLPRARRRTAVGPAGAPPPTPGPADEHTEPDPSEPWIETSWTPDPWSNAEPTVCDEVPPPEAAPTDETEAVDRAPSAAGPDLEPTVAVSPPDAADRTWAAPIAHARRIRGEPVSPPPDPTDPMPVADGGWAGTWVEAPVGCPNPQAFARTQSVAQTEDIVIPRPLSLSDADEAVEGGDLWWDGADATRALPGLARPGRGSRSEPRRATPRGRGGLTPGQLAMMVVIAIQAGLLGFVWWVW